MGGELGACNKNALKILYQLMKKKKPVPFVVVFINAFIRVRDCHNLSTKSGILGTLPVCPCCLGYVGLSQDVLDVWDSSGLSQEIYDIRDTNWDYPRMSQVRVTDLLHSMDPGASRARAML